MNHSLTLPRRPRGRMSKAGKANYAKSLAAFCDAIIQIDLSLDFKVGSRGWCYLLEEYGLDKGDFNAAQKLIADCRKSGELPLDICAEDGARGFINLEKLDVDDPEVKAEDLLGYVQSAHAYYQPFSFWDTQDFYVQMMVEKIDLKSLFAPICAKYNVALANARGNCDINARAEMMRRYAQNEAAGRQCVLLYAGDHDPAGLRISDFLEKNLYDLSKAVGWSPDNLIVDRFGLNVDFIQTHGLTWIENLETGSGGRLESPHHPDHHKAYVQEYLAQFGARKVEANALVTRPTAGRELCERAILQYIDTEGITAFTARTHEARNRLADAIARQLAGYTA